MSRLYQRLTYRLVLTLVLVLGLIPGLFSAAVPAAAQGLPAPELQSDRQHLTVFFDFDHAGLAPVARRALDRLAPTLRDHLAAGGVVLVDGHTDAVGSRVYNRILSERRALAVAAYLRDAWQIPERRLVLRAWGADLLRRPAAPRAAENRRVDISLIAAGQPAQIECRPLRIAPGSTHLDLDDFGGAPRPQALRPGVRTGAVTVLDCSRR